MISLPTLRQLQFFVALVRRKSFSRAAEDCLVSQSTLSAAIKELELALNAPLVDRSAKGFALTALGKEMVGRAEGVLALAEDMVHHAGQCAPLNGPLRLGIIPTIAPFVLSDMVERLEVNYPDLSLLLREDLTTHLIDRLRVGLIDMALLAFPYHVENIDHLIITEDPFWFVCAPEHRLATHKAIYMQELDAKELMLLEDGHCLRDHALSACKLQDNHIANAFGGTSLFTLIQMVRSGRWATLLPQMAVQQGLATAAGLVSIPLKAPSDQPAPHRLIGLAWRKNSGLDMDAAALAQIVAESLKTVIAER